MTIETYLSNHKIIQIGIPLVDHICCDIIVDNTDELISFVADTEYYISHIRWWDHTKIGFASPIGYGGAEDPNNPGYYFAETDISKAFDSCTTAKEYRSYIAEIKTKFPHCCVFPAFDIKRRKTGDGSLS